MATYFLSDLHLGASYLEDEHEVERRVCAFFDDIAPDADEIYLVGDILDYWFEYRYAVPRGYVRFFGKLAQLSDSGIKITWMIGNHDIWIFDYLPRELGIRVVDGNLTQEIQGALCFISHGDGVGKRDWKFRFIRSLFRNKVCQKLYSGIHPRWTIPFAHGWSQSSRSSNKDVDSYESNDNLLNFAEEYSSRHPEIRYFVFGHTHKAQKKHLEGGAEAVILGDWTYSASYARLQGGVMELLVYNPD